jgi:drug/metabolite transporter (DMT)-like permease
MRTRKLVKDTEVAGQASGAVPLTAGLILAGLCLLWGGNLVAIKISNQGIPPVLAAAVRSVVASLALWAYARSRRQGVFFPRKDLKHAVVLGALFGVEFIFIYWGLVFTNASRGTIFIYTQPLWTALGAHFLLTGDRLTSAKVSGLVLAFLGLISVFWSRSADLGPLYWLGDLMEVGGAICWSVTTLYVKRLVTENDYTHYQTLFAQLFFSIPVLAVGWLVLQRAEPIALSGLVVGALLYQSVIIAFMSYLVWFWLLHAHSASRLASFTFLAPLFGVLLSGLLLKETLSLSLWVALLLVAGGIYLVNRPPRVAVHS